MLSVKGFRELFRSIREKRRLSFRNQQTDTEVWYMHISLLDIVAGFLALLLILFVVITYIVAFTPLLEFIPGHPGGKARTMLIDNIMRLDSLEQELNHMKLYSDNVSLIMQGKSPVTREDIQRIDSLAKLTADSVSRVPEDSILRMQMESDNSPYNLNDPTAARRALRAMMELYTPVTGIVTGTFDPREGRYGVTLNTTANQPVAAVSSGTVISSVWVPDQGYVVYIQHPNNLISVYRRNTSVLKKAGDYVQGGEIIGSAGGADAGNSAGGIFEFELWYNGTAVDPQGYVVF